MPGLYDGEGHMQNDLIGISHAISKLNNTCFLYMIHLLGIHAFMTPFLKQEINMCC